MSTEENEKVLEFLEEIASNNVSFDLFIDAKKDQMLRKELKKIAIKEYGISGERIDFFLDGNRKSIYDFIKKLKEHDPRGIWIFIIPFMEKMDLK